MRMHVTIFVVLITLGVSASKAQVRWQDYLGVYQLDSVDVKGFESFWYFELLPSPDWQHVDPARCKVYWFPQKQLEDGQALLCTFREVRLTIDSLSFRTQSCLGEEYSFQGRFTMPPGEFMKHPRDIVLQGSLRLWNDSSLIKQARVSFNWDESGD